MSYDIEYKKGDCDDVGARILENGSPVDLTGYTVQLVIKNTAARHVLDCSLGGTVNLAEFSAIEGGVTIHFTDTETATVGQYQGEFVLTLGTNVVHVPSGPNYLSIAIWDSL